MAAELMGSALLDASFSILKQNLLGKSTEDYLEELANKLAVIQTVLFDAGAKQFLDESVRQWADKVEDLCYEADGVLDEWRTAVLKSQLGLSSPEKVCFYVPSSCFLLPQFRRWLLRRDTRRKIIELNKNLDEIAMEKERFGFERKVFREERRITTSSTSLVDESKIYGRSDDKDRLISMLLSAGSKDKVVPEIIPIVGMGGIGKTTLAQLAYNDCKVKAHFDLRIWVHVGDAFDSISIAEQIMKAITGPISTLFELESLLSYISRSIEGKRFLLVLDDVWTEDLTKWESFEGSIRHGAVGSRVLVTTRKETVAHMMGATSSMIFLEKLSDDTCWLLFKNLAFSGGKEPVELEEIVKKILMKCNGIPLVAKALGSLMRSKYTREDWVAVSEHELWELGDVCSDIFAPLLLSYYDLPSLEKRCLLYCSLIPVECEIDKDDLIELWMSQGYLDANKNYEMGERCFESLAMRSFFQDFEMNFHGEIMTCKMHDIIHDLVQFLTRNSCICEVFGDDERTNQEYKTTRHYTLVLRSGAQIPISVYEKRKLRTLFVKRKEILTALNLNMLSELASLRTLCLSGCGIEKLPSGIDKLKHLRYLNLSDSPKLEELPYELCCLLNLQTLRLNGCTALRSLPKQMGKLMNLQHLYIEGCNQLQGLRKGIGRLSSLRRLDVFIVPRDYLQNNAEMNLGDFNNLKHLQGHLHICRIGNVEHAADAEEAHLRTKPNLADLQLSFSQRTGPRRTEDEWKVLLDVLQPHPDLKSLEIRKYNGATFSNWIVSMENLRRVVLNFCPNCVFLPPFGRLASLEILHIENMDKLVTVGPEFLGVKTGGDTSEIETWLVSFPKLKQLCFQYLNNWNQWLGIDDSMSSLKIMPSLRSLNIANCIKLRTLPDFIPTVPVQELTIDNCPSLDKEKNWSKISHIANIQKVGNDNELDSPGRPQHEKVFIDESEEKSSKGKGKEDIDGRRKSLNEVMEP